MDAHHGCECDWVKSFCPAPRGNCLPSLKNQTKTLKRTEIQKMSDLILKYLPDSLRCAHKFGILRSMPIFSLRPIYRHNFHVCIARIFRALDSIVSLDTHRSHLDNCYSNAFRSALHHNNRHTLVCRLNSQLVQPVYMWKIEIITNRLVFGYV